MKKTKKKTQIPVAQANTDKRLNEALELLTSIAQLDFTKVLPILGDGSAQDALAGGLNMLSEELKYSLAKEKAARLAAEMANQIKDDFLATLSHELRTPLTVMLSWSQMLRTGKLNADLTRRGLEFLEQSAKTQSQLIGDLMDISRIQAGKTTLEIQCIDAAEFISDAVNATRSLAAVKAIQIEMEIDPSVKTIFADPLRLQQILWNLITNSIKFSSPNGWIQIKMKRVLSPERICIQVRDNGKGIKPEFLPIIFERFTQADSTSTRTHGGMGLGLELVRKFVEMHDGTIEVESPGEGQGAIFTIFLPLKSFPSDILPAAEVEAKPAAEVNLRGLRILFVDDDKYAREVFAVIFESLGAQVETAESVSQAIAVFEEFKPDVLVSDIAMPIEDGYSLIGKIRAMKSKLASVPALALTAYASREDVQRAHQNGFQAHMSKPVDADKLALAIARVARRN